VRTIRRSGEHLAGLVDGLLDIAKIEAGRLQLSQETIATAEFLDQIADMFRLQAESKGIDFFYEPPERLPEVVRTDEKRLRQILINLLSNAVKYTDQGFVRLTVQWRNEVAEFAVHDTGIGIEAADLERIFVPFERIEAPTGPWVPGTGLGLTITKLMSEVMGGEITVMSTPGVGSRFTVRLYLPWSTAPGPRLVEPGRVEGYRGPVANVLVVDDEESHRDLIHDILSRLGLDVERASGGTQCLDLVAAKAPQLVLLDVTMPGLNGWDVARRLREDLLYSGAIIMMSAAVAMERAGPDSRRFHDGFVVKPFEIDRLLQEISRVTGIAWRRAGEAMPRPPASSFKKGALPPRRALEDLKALCEIGFARGLAQRLDDLRPHAASAAFIDHLTTLTQELRLDDVLIILGAALNDTDDARTA
jgi:CheY-like chemotaxis protein/anti-sigma regulatory factor (Ser/Thr protein kinase)